MRKLTIRMLKNIRDMLVITLVTAAIMTVAVIRYAPAAADTGNRTAVQTTQTWVFTDTPPPAPPATCTYIRSTAATCS